MTTDTKDTETQTTADADQNDEDAAMADGYSQVTGTELRQPAESVAENESAAAAPPDSAAAASSQPTDQPTDQPTETPAGLSDEEITTLRRVLPEVDRIRQGHDKLAGRFGDVNRRLQEITQGHGQPMSAAMLSILDAVFDDVAAEYPDLAAVLKTSLKKRETANQNTGAQPTQHTAAPAAVDTQAVEQRVIEHVERRLLNRDHPGWETDIAARDANGDPIRDASGKYVPSEMFMGWFASKPEEYRRQFVGAMDADFLSSGLTEFKEYRKSKQAGTPAQPAADAAPAQAAAAPSRKDRLAAAVIPASAPAPAGGARVVSEDEALAQGWKAVRGG